jgi:hypothetical protein
MKPLTVKDIRELIEDLSDDAVVTYERIEDSYFHNNNWKLEAVEDYSMPGSKDYYIEGCTAFIQDGKLRISAHY